MSSSVRRDFERRVAAFVGKEQLLHAGALYLVALSGGADSVALLLALRNLGYAVEAATCNFRLRGAESDRDEHFCVALCEREGIPLHRVHFDTRAYAGLHKVSLEMAARELRYAYFERLRADIGAEAVCVAHHRDDCVETVLLNLVRGTGLHGLRGILPRNGHILRPLLTVSRKDIEGYLRALGQDYVTDSSNLVDDVQRNKIRLDVLPLLERINPAVRDNIYRTALYAAEAAKVFDAAMSRAEAAVTDERDGSVSVGRLLAQPSPEYTLYSILRRYGFGSAQAEQVYAHLHADSGRCWSSATHEVLVDRGRLLIQKKCASAPRQMRIPETGTYVYDDERRFVFSLETVGHGYQPVRDTYSISADASQVVWPLTVRGTVSGDRFVPFGMKGSKLVSDYLTDRKRSLFDKRRQLVVADARGRIVWLVGERLDDRFRVRETTAEVLRIALRG